MYEFSDFVPSLLQLQAATEKTDADLTEVAKAAAREIRRLDARIDTVQLLPGPQGEPGPPGMDGRDGADGISVVGRDGQPGRDGKDGAPGAPGLVWRGEWSKKGSYLPGDAVAWDGSSYMCIAPTKSEPPSKQWDLLAAAGLDGKTPKTKKPLQSSAIFLPSTVRREEAFQWDTGRTCVAGESLMLCEVVRWRGNGIIEKADYTQANALGFVRSPTGCGGRCPIQTSGVFESDDWGSVIEEGGDLQPGWVYRLSATPGKITANTAPIGAYYATVGKALSSTRFSIEVVTGDLMIATPEYRDIVLTLTNSTDETIAAGVALTRPTDTTCCPCVWDDVCIGLAAESIPAHADGAVRVEGVLELDWTAATGNATLTVGAKYYNDLDDMSKLTTESGGDREWVGVALSESQMMVAKRSNVPRGL